MTFKIQMEGAHPPPPASPYDNTPVTITIISIIISQVRILYCYKILALYLLCYLYDTIVII